MRVGSSLILVFVIASGCGGAIESKLLQGDGSAPVEAGPQPEAAPDVIQTPDVMHTPDVAPQDVMQVMETAPPEDTGPPDTGSKLPPVQCAGDMCLVPAEDCCVNSESSPPTAACQPIAQANTGCYSMGNTPVECAQGADCPTGLCCGIINSDDSAYEYVLCKASCSGTGTEIIFCSSAADCTSLGMGAKCGASDLLPGYTVCKT
jgi:hypothetical protein